MMDTPSILQFRQQNNENMTHSEYSQKLEKIIKRNIEKQYRENLTNEKNKYKQKHKFETSKIIAIYLFVLLNAIVVYAMLAMWTFADFTYLGVLISDIAAQVIVYAIYCMKAYKAKRSEEELKFRRECNSGTINDILDAGAECAETFTIDTDNEVIAG